jgi:Zn-dependent oligopeptidase
MSRSASADEAYKAFRGRGPDPAALMKKRGLDRVA